MEITPMTVQHRQESGKGSARKLRASGMIPGVVYGVGEAPQAISFDGHTFETLMRKGSIHGLINVEFEGTKDSVTALAREIQIHPVTRQVLHVDLQRVDMSKPIHLSVSITLVGKPEGVRNQGGILEHNLREVEIECRPDSIPDTIEVDVTDLEVGQALHVSDLKADGVTFLGHAETTVATVSLPAAERTHEEAEEEAAAEAAEGEASTAAAEGEASQETKEGSEGGS
jgi:large subunit ribosomal protein L25